MLENSFKKVVKRELDKRGIWWFNVVQGAVGTTKGISDILGVVPVRIDGDVYGIFCAIEVKRSDGKGGLSKHQKKFLERVRENKGLAFVVDSEDALRIALTVIDGINSKEGV